MRTDRDWQARHLHFVGIGGSGMSGLALACASIGARVTGSDQQMQPVIERLRASGIDATVGHAPENVPADAELVYSSAVKPQNVERVRARELGLRELRRGDLLAELSRLRRCIAVAGTHGKTTTAAMTVWALRGAGIDASYVIGAELRDGSASADWGPGDWLVLETDESDRSFLSCAPEIGIVTNIALEHINQYRSLEDVRQAFAEFIAGAARVVIADQPQLRELCGTRDAHPFAAGDVQLSSAGCGFRWREYDVSLAVPGAHNAANAAAALEACALAGAEPGRAVRALSSYPGAKRRLERRGRTAGGAVIYEDYAIHANEIRATLAALRTIEAGRAIAVFEPLLFSRTKAMAPDLGLALAEADAIVVLELFPGSEVDTDAEGVSGRLVAAEALRHAGGRPVAWKPTVEQAHAYLESVLRPDDACVVMGISGAAKQLAEGLIAEDGVTR